VKRAPSHARGLPAWERLVFALVFVLMAGFVVVVTVSAARSDRSARPIAGSGAGAAHPDKPGGGGVQPVTDQGSSPNVDASSAVTDTSLDRRLAAVLRPVLRRDSGHFAVGVIDVSTGAEAVYDAHRHFRAASLVKADILAALLLRDQNADASLTDHEAALAVPMIEDSNDGATAGLWGLAGGGSGIAAANTSLLLSHTVLGSAGSSGMTRTTVLDQLQLLADLATASSPLTSASRDYELGLMEEVQADQRWGVSAAASAGTSYAIKDGWLPDPTLWVVNSIGVVEHDGQQLLLAVLSSGQPSEAAGIAAIQAAAAAAAVVIAGR
jgi:hypothetical protein